MVWVIGEALIDLVQQDPGAGSSGGWPYLAFPGGSPFNVAIGLARLGQPTHLQARFSTDAFGRLLRAHGLANGLDLAGAITASEPSTLAILSLDESRNAVYDFHLEGAADWQWTETELDQPADGWLHTGSLASWRAPGSAAIHQRLRAVRALGGNRISYDPNVRPALMGSRTSGVAAVERMVALCDVVKASAEDLEWLYPGAAVLDVLARWRRLGPELVVVTDGGAGLHALIRGGEPLHLAPKPVRLVDTVGAGDAFMSGLINALVRTDLLSQADPSEGLAAVLAEASLVAGLTCARAGADPPTAAELAAAQAP